MRDLLRVVLDVFRPGHPQFKAQLSQLSRRQADLATALHLLDNPVTREVKAATDAAAEFE